MSSNKPTLTNFEALLDAARQQPEPQRLLFVFASKSLPDQPTEQQRSSFGRSQGGSLQPRLCVDKAPEDIPGFAALVAESAQTGQQWDVVFVGSLEGRGGIPPNSDEADQPLRFMVNAINDGRVSEFAAFDCDGHPLRFL